MASYDPNGETLELKDAALYIDGLDNKEAAREMGTRGTVSLLNILKDRARTEGFKKLRIQYQRTEKSSSKNPGHTEDKTMDL
ncbi:hypothetical protein SAMN05518672_103451 [Chitinophaga sp. CF118]|uniref:hypothetical protein n=1 Tax=Chitinophaga sp. CF118 TaxID=1884367 RepID=UPI0008EE3431|nr:hypothetical protein [Chitinophaga sp. CF118]SFD83956.1 hypothetical protein SAMN05518672_103451 [Chitinophaga sp. CF118]